jgi:hypothetical protein
MPPVAPVTRIGRPLKSVMAGLLAREVVAGVPGASGMVALTLDTATAIRHRCHALDVIGDKKRFGGA